MSTFVNRWWVSYSLLAMLIVGVNQRVTLCSEPKEPLEKKSETGVSELDRAIPPEKRKAVKYLRVDDRTIKLLQSHLKDFPNLEDLDVYPSKYPKELMEEIGELDKLKMLSIGCGDDGLKYLKSLKNLEELYLSGATISDEGLQNISPLNCLKKLTLARGIENEITFDSVGSLPSLEELDINGDAINDKAVPNIVKRFRKLRKIHLGDTKVTQHGGLGFSELPWLIQLGFPDEFRGGEPGSPKHIEFAKEYNKRYFEHLEIARKAGEVVPDGSRVPISGGLLPDWKKNDFMPKPDGKK